MWWRKKRPAVVPEAALKTLRQRYASFRELLALNTDCLELMAGLQEDLQYVPARRDIVQAPVTAIFEKAATVVATLEEISGKRFPLLLDGLRDQQEEIERYLAAAQERSAPRLAARLSELNAQALPEGGGKAAVLGEVKTRVGLPVPEGFVITTEAYRQFCGIPLWTSIRDALRDVDPDDLTALQAASRRLQELVLSSPVPRAVEVAITERARRLAASGQGLAVRSSALGEGGDKAQTTYAGQFLTLLNVPPEQAVEAYRRVLAARFSERALSYRLSTGLLEVETPMAVLFLPVIAASASGVMYTRDPADPRSKSLWVTATRGLGIEIASGRMPADLFVLSRQRPHSVLDRNLVPKLEELVVQTGGGLVARPVGPTEAEAPSLAPEQLWTLAEWGIRIEEHFQAPQDIEWVSDQFGALWIVQSRNLAMAEPARLRAKARPRGQPLVEGGRTVYPGRVSGPAHLIDAPESAASTPPGSIVFVPRPSPEIVQVFPRIGGLVAVWGNLAGHAAALLREFKIPSVFLMNAAMDKVSAGSQVSLDAVQARVYAGALWESRTLESVPSWSQRERFKDPLSRRLLTLNLVDATAANFRPAGCRSAHDVLRFCHEAAVEAMFAVTDILEGDPGRSAKEFRTEVPLNLLVLDLGGGLRLENPDARAVSPAQVVSRPFRALWRGVTHPQVSWTRDMPASLTDVASVMAGWLTPQTQGVRALGEKSYLLVADQYMNLNARLAYHFTLVDACVSDNPLSNYISFRFAGGGATWRRRNLRASFVEACLTKSGFTADRRGDIVNAWFKKAAAEETEQKLDLLGRLIACTGHLDMYMASTELMRWYVQQFLSGNYSFRPAEGEVPGSN